MAITGGVVYLASSSDGSTQAMQQMRDKTSASQQTQDSDMTTMNTAPTAPAARPGVYTDYTSGVIASTTGTKLLFFHAPWCPQCRALEADIKKQGVPDGVTIIKVDYDSNQKLRQQYGVTIQTTLVKVDDAGNLVKKYVAYDDPTLAAVSKELL